MTNPDTSKIERKEICHPTIDFVLDVEQDIGQIRWRMNGGYKGWADFEQELDTVSNNDEVYRIAEEKIRQFWDDHHDEMKVRAAVVRDDWVNVQKVFYRNADHFFSEYPWPKPPSGMDSYTGYASMLNSFPRHIREKSFSFPANPLHSSRGRAIKVTAHEILHFMEYEYMEKKFGLTPSERGSADNTFWQFTENLNVLIENSDLWKEIMQGETSKPYPICEELYGKMKEIWDRSQCVDDLIREIFQKQLTAQER